MSSRMKAATSSTESPTPIITPSTCGKGGELNWPEGHSRQAEEAAELWPEDPTPPCCSCVEGTLALSRRLPPRPQWAWIRSGRKKESSALRVAEACPPSSTGLLLDSLSKQGAPSAFPRPHRLTPWTWPEPETCEQDVRPDGTGRTSPPEGHGPELAVVREGRPGGLLRTPRSAPVPQQGRRAP